MLQRGDYAREICYFVVVDVSPFPLQPVCIYYLPLISGLFTLASAGVIALFFIYRIHNDVFNGCMYTCIFIKLHITAQSGPVIRVILCHSH